MSPLAWLLSKLYPNDTLYSRFSQHGWILLRRHYYLPFPDDEDLTFVRDTELVGVDMNDAGCLELLDTIVTRYMEEFKQFSVQDTGDPQQFHLVNGSYMAVDAHVYYALLRHHKPGRIVEIGSGQSTLLAAAAIRKNRQESGSTTELICVEPYPRPYLSNLPEITQLLKTKVQKVDLELFASLQAGDILFIDSTHVLRPGGDVWWEDCEILPRLASGVLIHVHDVALPKPYATVYQTYHWHWTEQYLLQAILTYGQRYEVMWAGNYMHTKYPAQMEAIFQRDIEVMRAKYPQSEPASFWMRVRAH
jgi:predicted O-methyltransferase YrrM